MHEFKSTRLSSDGNWSAGLCLLMALLTIGFGLPAFAALEKPNSIDKPSPVIELRVGSEIDFPPYATVNSAGQADGYAIDLLKAVARTADLNLKFQIASWSRIRERLESGAIDVLPLMAKSKQRAEKVDFSDTHIFAYDAIFVRKDNFAIRSQADLKNKRLIVEEGDLAEDYLRASQFPGEIITASSPLLALKMLRAGHGDAVICSQVVGLMALNDEKISDVKLAEEPHFGAYEREFAFAIRKGNGEVVRRLNEGLKAVIASGEYRSIYNKWFANLDPEVIRREKNRSQLQLILTIAILVSLVSAAFVMIFKREVNRKTKSLAESEQRFRGLVENLPGLVFRSARVVDIKTGSRIWKIIYMSDACERITGYPASDFISDSRRIMSIVHPDDLLTMRNLRARLFQTPDRYALDFRIVHRSGKVVWLHSRGSSTPGAQSRDANEVQYLDAIFLDISEQKRVADLLTEQQSKLASSARLSSLGEMAGGIAHEINNPLAIINLRIHQLTQLASRGDVKSEIVVRIGSQIEATAIRISKIIKSLQTVARESEHDPFESVSVRTIFSEVFELCFQRMRKHEIEVEVSNIDERLVLECKRVQIAQVLINLLNNAFDAVVDEKVRWIHLTAKESRDNNLAVIEFSITDSGRGIPKDKAQKIFQPFFTTKEIGKGTGLGLSISKGIIEAHHGNIWLDPTSRQTRIVFVLPKYQNLNSRNRSAKKTATPQAELETNS